jgi:hypothetical protein
MSYGLFLNYFGEVTISTRAVIAPALADIVLICRSLFKVYDLRKHHTQGFLGALMSQALILWALVCSDSIQEEFPGDWLHVKLGRCL